MTEQEGQVQMRLALEAMEMIALTEERMEKSKSMTVLPGAIIVTEADIERWRAELKAQYGEQWVKDNQRLLDAQAAYLLTL